MKRIENLSRTGFEYPFMRDLGHAPFISQTKEFEPLLDRICDQNVYDTYIREDTERSGATGNKQYQIVYDYIENSPYYDGENAKYGPYIDEKDLIELPNPHEQSSG